MPFRKKKKTESVAPDHSLGENIVKELTEIPQPIAFKKLAKRLGISKKSRKRELAATLDYLVGKKLIAQLEDDSYTLPPSNEDQEKGEFVEGRFMHFTPRYGIVAPLEETWEVKIDSRDASSAVDGDKVKVQIVGKPRGSRNQAKGRVVEILERKHETMVGMIETGSNFAFLVPDNKRIRNDIFIPLKSLNGAEHGHKAIVKITKWPSGDKKAEGEVIRVLGEAGEHETEIHAIMAEFGLPFEFPPEVEEAANQLPDGVQEKDIKNRKDLRSVTTFTIDPETAKDFDDAISISFHKDGSAELGVHIADVSHYVQPGSILDEEAFERATSVYLVDRTIPMLPEKISNGLCSLNPNDDKLTFSVLFNVTPDGRISKPWIGRTVIHSDRRFTYEEAQEIIEKEEGEYAKELVWINAVAKKLREERLKKGAIAFESVEFRFHLEQDGTPIGMFPKMRKDAHKLVEEYMLVANRLVAEYAGKQKVKDKQKTFVYRIHDNPDPEKLENFTRFAAKFGQKLDLSPKNVAHEINKMVSEIEGKPEEDVLQSLAIRTMAKAKYSTENIGHFGLAFKDYTHFTSPIRRYPDVMVHRLLQHYLDKGKSVHQEEYEDYCNHCSEKEKQASDAERASIKYKQVEFMGQYIGKTMDGIVSGISDFGIYVELNETRCEGMVRISDLGDDYYEFDADNYRLIGKRNKKIISFGDPMTVTVSRTDLKNRQIDFKPYEQDTL